MASVKLSPLRAVLQTDISEAKASTVRYYKRKAVESVDSLLNFIAPSQGQVLKEEIFKASNIESADEEEIIIADLSKLYTETVDNSLKSQILSVLSKRLTKAELVDTIPGITMYRIDQARQQYNANSVKGLHVKEKVKVPRRRMDDGKLQHALSFFFDPSFMQLVSYGTRDLKLDSGESITIPEVVRTANHSKMIELYMSYCKETDFQPLVKATLFKILNVCSATKRTNLHGLDNIAAEGVEGFDTLKQITSQLLQKNHLTTEEHEQLQKTMTSAKLYLKTDYKLHLERESHCADHCLQWLLSDPMNASFQNPCNHIHSLKCDRCQLLQIIKSNLSKGINQIEDDDVKEETQKSFDDTMQKIYDWKSHIIRNVNQEEFRTNKLENLKRFEGIIIMDWAMKFLPMRYREKQTDWFGQRGKHWHVSVCIYRDENGEIGHRTFTHVIENVKQDWYAVASLLENILQTMKIQIPHVTDVYLRSDNAGCYHCGHLWIAIPQISQRTGLHIKQYSYSEAQAGKSYCDSKIAHMRTKMRSYVANGNDILSAADMKTAIDHGAGVAGCQVAHVSIDASKHVIKTHSLKNVSTYNDVKFTDSNVEFRKAYQVGKGLLLSYDDLAKAAATVQTETGCVIQADFVIPVKVRGCISLSKAKKSLQPETIPGDTLFSEESFTEHTAEIDSSLFNCPEPGCIKVCSSYKSLESHVLVGIHEFKLERESVYDSIRKQWAELCNNVVITKKNVVDIACTSETVETLSMGWALKRVRKVKRFPTKIRNFLTEKFLEGEKSGKKCNPNEVATEMKALRDTDSRRVFQINECLNSNQIASYFSRLGSTSSKKNKEIDLEDDDLLTSAAELDHNELLISVITSDV
ncbi:uncharacterized protein LOC133197244 [Saccostrea echinata]|uniref:uncharacterized protein LOC133197244 n=1 Tax=Saccostrea echinata TaxID=191078 RepID=UPI002A7ED21D|nr:uncharacterized protein LOC133197244 [Saccostrea echinata]